jgi:hypothetical protein
MNRKLAHVLTLLALAACNLPAAAAAPTLTATPAELATEPASPATADPGLPTLTASPETPAGASLEAIWIASPGAGSTVSTPLTVNGQSRPTFEQNLVVAVYGEGGAELALQPTTIAADAGSPGPFTIALDFAVHRGQPGRVAVYETSALDGGIVHLSSAEVTLLPAGEVTNIVPAPAAYENMDITFPVANVEISGGTITVSGVSEYYFESQLGLLLCGGGGSGAPDALCGTVDNILASGVAMIASPEMGQPGPFSGTLTWSISEPTPGRIVVYAASARDGGLVHVTSIPVLIQP